jgi:hypothetical protein
MSRARSVIAVALLALGAALVITAGPREEQLTALVLVGRHSGRPCTRSVTSLATSSLTRARAQACSSACVNFEFLSVDFIHRLCSARHW